MKIAHHLAYQEQSSGTKNPYATPQEFVRLFETELAELFCLALHLTGDPEKTERCLRLAMKDCVESSSVAKQWAQIWARRMIIRNAIPIVLGADNSLPEGFPFEAVSDFNLQPTNFNLDKLRESATIMNLPDLERLVFVICVLERYSTVDCALLLRKSPRDVSNARLRAERQVGALNGLSHLPITTSASAYSSFGDEAPEVDF